MNKYYTAEVRSVKDPWESGRVQVRIYGMHDDEQNIKDEDLPWATPLQPIYSAATGRIGTSPTGMIVGSRVIVFFIDEEQQYPVILGTFARAGKQKTEEDNTLGKDDIDDTYSDVPMQARGSQSNPRNQRSKLTDQNAQDVTQNDDKYNKAHHVEESEGEELTNKAKKKYSKSANLATIASANQSSDLMSMILKVDPQNKSGALPQAPKNIQQILQLSNMTSMSGINGLMSGGLGGIMGMLSNELGLGEMVGQLSGMMGGIMSGGGGGGGGGGGAPAGASGPYAGGSGTETYTYYVPQTIGTIAATAADILNMLGGSVTSTDQIASLTALQKEALYTALLDMMNRVAPKYDVTTTVTANISGNSFYVLAPPYSGITATEIVGGVPVIKVTTANTFPAAQLPGDLVDFTSVPNGYFQVFTYSSTDPYPGYIEWEGPNGELIFSPRPPTMPYAQHPNEDAVNAGIFAMITDLSKLVTLKQTTLVAMTGIMDKGNGAVQNQGLNNSMGNGAGGDGAMAIAQQLLGLLGQLLQMAQQNHLPNSVLSQGSMQQTLQNMSKQMSFAKRKKDAAKQAVQQKNQKPQGTADQGQGLLAYGQGQTENGAVIGGQRGIAGVGGLNVGNPSLPTFAANPALDGGIAAASVSEGSAATPSSNFSVSTGK